MTISSFPSNPYPVNYSRTNMLCIKGLKRTVFVFFMWDSTREVGAGLSPDEHRRGRGTKL